MIYRHMKRLFSLFITALVCICAQAQTRYVGGDISMLPQYEKYNFGYKDATNKKIKDLITWFMNDCGWNTFRVRLFVHPNPDFGKAHYKDGNNQPLPTDISIIQDLDYVTALGKRIKEAGGYFMLDFHYSDFWVDAGKILPPDAWIGLSDALMADSLGQYTRRVLQTLKDSGATPDLVQVGNEIMYGLCGIRVHPYNSTGDNWNGYLGLLKAGCNAVRELCPDAKIIIHTDRPCNRNYDFYYYNKLEKGGVDFDVIGLSYYPFWHADMTPSASNTGADVLKPLVSAVNYLANKFPTKTVQIVEFAYNYQYWPSAGINYDTRPVWPCPDGEGSEGIEGQYKFVKDFVDNLKPLENLEGICYWFPEEAGKGDKEEAVMGGWLNRGFWKPTASSTGHAILKTNSVSGDRKPEDVCAPYYMRNFYWDSTEDIANLTLPSGIQSRKILKEGQLLILRPDGSLFGPEGTRR